MMDDGLRLLRFNVLGLFGEFDHEIQFNTRERVTALIGPNGLGKTACLRLINSLFRRQWSTFSTTDFARIEFLFSNMNSIVVEPLAKADPRTEVSDSLGVIFTTLGADGEPLDWWAPRENPERTSSISRIETYLPFLTRTGPRIWTHDRTRERYTFQEVIDNFSDELPDSYLDALGAKASEPLELILSQFDCHLIETQRLLVFRSDDHRRGIPSTLAISAKAERLKTIIAGELGRYAAISQSLDRSFPRRVLQLDDVSPVRDLSSNLTELDALRNGLNDAGILVSEEEDGIPTTNPVNPAIASVLGVYVEDTKRKLQVLEGIQAKVLLFKELIDDRFYPKTVNIDTEAGFLVKRNTHVNVPLEKLSSGEQHQLVLFFELLFELKSNAIILIDEPELSLHVGWQKKFISDLKRIINLNKFDVLLATHSPQLVGEWEHVVVELGDVDPE